MAIRIETHDIDGQIHAGIELEDGHTIAIEPYDDYERNEMIARICCDALNALWPKFSKDEYEEYRRLKQQAERMENFISLGKVTRLEDDIDLPIKRCVAAFALLGCQPLWSCCGFDYYGQPLHKSHQYGRIFFILGRNPFSEKLCETLTAKTDWEYNPHNGNLDLHIDVKNVVSQWDFRECPHYHEPFAWRIQNLEEYLFSMKNLFVEEVTLRDTNGPTEAMLPYWQYSTMEDWVICRKDYI